MIVIEQTRNLFLSATTFHRNLFRGILQSEKDDIYYYFAAMNHDAQRCGEEDYIVCILDVSRQTDGHSNNHVLLSSLNQVRWGNEFKNVPK